MHSLASIPCARVELSWDRDLPNKPPMQRARQLRGALANAFRDDPLFHQHDPATGKLLYRYPLVQYRWQEERGLVIGWGEAAKRLLDRPWLDLSLQLGDEQVNIADALLILQHGQFGVSERLEHYRMRSHALLFNQENYHRYQAMNEPEQCAERGRLLVSNLLIALRGLEITFPERLYATFAQARAHPCHYKGQDLIGIGGEFVSNVVLPDGFSFGHAVSHGYGWLSH